MLQVSEETILSFGVSIQDITDRDAYTEEFWDRLEEENPAILEYVLGHTEVLNTDEERSLFLDGVFTIYEFFRRQEESDQMDKDFV